MSAQHPYNGTRVTPYPSFITWKDGITIVPATAGATVPTIPKPTLELNRTFSNHRRVRYSGTVDNWFWQITLSTFEDLPSYVVSDLGEWPFTQSDFTAWCQCDATVRDLDTNRLWRGGAFEVSDPPTGEMGIVPQKWWAECLGSRRQPLGVERSVRLEERWTDPNATYLTGQLDCWARDQSGQYFISDAFAFNTPFPSILGDQTAWKGLSPMCP